MVVRADRRASRGGGWGWVVTLPGSLTSPVAGPLLRRGAPCHLLSGPCRCVVLDVAPDGGHVVFALDDHGWEPGDADPEDLALDLTDDLGMDIAARWLARHHGLTVGATAPEWKLFRGSWTLFGATSHALCFDGIDSALDPREALRLACLATGATP